MCWTVLFCWYKKASMGTSYLLCSWLTYSIPYCVHAPLSVFPHLLWPLFRHDRTQWGKRGLLLCAYYYMGITKVENQSGASQISIIAGNGKKREERIKQCYSTYAWSTCHNRICACRYIWWQLLTFLRKLGVNHIALTCCICRLKGNGREIKFTASKSMERWVEERNKG